MKHFVRLGLMLFIVYAAFLPAALAEHYTYDQKQSSVSFTIKHLGLITVSGAFKQFEGSFDFDASKIAATRVRILIKSGSVESGNKLRDKDLRSKNFFWADQYPEITFEGLEVKNIEGNRFDIHGNLTIKGITNPAVFKTELLETAASEGPLAFHTWAVIHRKDYQLGKKTVFDPILLITNEELRIDLNVRGIPTGKKFSAEETSYS